MSKTHSSKLIVESSAVFAMCSSRREIWAGAQAKLYCEAVIFSLSTREHRKSHVQASLSEVGALYGTWDRKICEALSKKHGKFYRNTLHFQFVSHFLEERIIVFSIDQYIVKNLVGDMFFEPAGDEGKQGGNEEVDIDKDNLASFLVKIRAADKWATKWAWKIFKFYEADSEKKTKTYTVAIPKTKVKLFNLFLRYTSFDSSFHQFFNLAGMKY